MTWQAARAVLDIDDMKPTAKFVLIAIALRAGTDGRAWPSIARLAADTGHSRSTVRFAIKRLARGGWLQVVHNPGSTLTMTLTAPVPGAPTAPDNGAGASSKHQKRAGYRPLKSKEEIKKYAPTDSTAQRSVGADNSNGRAPVDNVARTEVLRDQRDTAAAACRRCDELGWDDKAGTWCAHGLAK
jgi:DNA-binding transcriptional MocR family regulator